MKETIELIVKVQIEYNKKSDRKEAIKKSKELILSTRRGGGNIRCATKSAKMYKTDIELVNW